MHTELVYIFPDITPTDEVLFPLAQIFEQVIFLNPVEDDLPTEEDLTPLLREMMDQKCVDFICPAPLSDDRDRFLQLVHDVRYRPDDYASQLSNLSLAGLGRGEKAESEYSIMNTLLRQTDIQAGAKNREDNTPEDGKEQEDKQRSELLWQARLLLKLGEIIDRKQEDVRKSLERIALRENALLEEMHNKEAGTLLQHVGQVSSSGISVNQLRLRLKAWSQLFVGSQQQTQETIFVTPSRDAFELLMEHYRQEYTAEPRHLLTLPVPAVMAGDNFIKQRSRFQEDAAALLGLIREELDDLDGSLFFEKKREDEWSALLERHYPAAENGRCRLSLYFLPEITPQKIFCDTFADGHENDVLDQAGNRGAGTGAIIGTMEVLTAGSDQIL